MGIFSRATRENYNESLEEILENKSFNSETKNLLLSMLYKIENSYDDYYKVKPMAETKKEFIEKILYIIKDECEYLETITPKTEKSKILDSVNKNCIIDITEGRIIVYANEKDILYSLIKLNAEYTLYKYYNNIKMTEEEKEESRAVSEFIANGVAMSKSEVIRDFNGWSWACSVMDIENININLIYQNILILTENKIERIRRKNDDITNLDLPEVNSEEYSMQEKSILYEEKQPINIVEEIFESVFLKNKVSEILRNIRIIMYSNLIKEDVELRYKIEKQLKADKKQLTLMQDKKRFSEIMAKEKRKINEEIKKIDKILNNRDLLEEEYNKRNAKLPNQKKIFSISHLDTIIEKEKSVLLKKYKYLNKLLEPKEYLKENERLHRECVYLEKVVDATDKKYAEEVMKDIQVEFLKCLKVKIEAAETKEELIKLIYNFRYYCVQPINELQQIKDIPELKEYLKEVMNILIDKSIDKNVLENISNSISLCYNTLKYVFESKIVDLEKIYIKILKISEENDNKNEKGKIYNILISLYDYKDEEEKNEEIVNNLELLNIKLNKKTALFV